MSDVLAEFVVFGDAATAGSKKAFVNPKTGKVIVTDDSGKKGRTWRQDVVGAALEARSVVEPFDGAVILEATFFRARPKGHYGSGRNASVLKPGAPAHPVTKPDATKLLRAVEDALKGIVWTDDARVVDQVTRKRFGRPERVEVRVLAHPQQLVADLPPAERPAAPEPGEQGSLLAA